MKITKKEIDVNIEKPHFGKNEDIDNIRYLFFLEYIIHIIIIEDLTFNNLFYKSFLCC
jgi:hypothetical protein